MRPFHLEDDKKDAPHPTTRLYLALIAQALQDATGPVNAYCSEAERDDARRWLSKPSKDLRIMCGLAGVEPDQVIKLAKIKIALAMSQRTEDAKPKRTPSERHRISLTLKDETKSLMGWADATGLSVSALQARLRRGISVEEALTTPRVPRSQANASYLQAKRCEAVMKAKQKQRLASLGSPIEAAKVNNPIKPIVNNELAGGGVETFEGGQGPAGIASFDSAPICKSDHSASETNQDCVS